MRIRLSNHHKILLVMLILLVVNAGVFFYAWHQGQEVAETACEASALTSKELQNVYRRNMAVVWPQLYRNGNIDGEGLSALTENSVNAILRLDEVERNCIKAIDEG